MLLHHLFLKLQPYALRIQRFGKLGYKRVSTLEVKEMHEQKSRGDKCLSPRLLKQSNIECYGITPS